MNVKKVKEALQFLLKKEVDQVITPFVIGPPGIGKSEMIKQIMEEQGFDHLIDIRMSQHDNTDIKGIPKILDDARVIKWFPPEFLPIVGSKYEGESGILFFDEINRAQPDVLQSIFEIVYDRKIGGIPILDNWKIVCAGNLGADDGCDVFEMDNALKNRFVTLQIGVNEIMLKDWAEWAEENNVNKNVLGYVNKNIGKLYLKDEENLITPRSWVTFGKLLDNNIGKETEVTLLLGEGIIYSCVPSFIEYLSLVVKIEPRDLFNNIEKVTKLLKNIERSDIYELNEKIMLYIKEVNDGKEKQKKFNKDNFKNFKTYYEECLTEDNKIAILEKFKEKELIPFLEDFFNTFPKLNAEEGSPLFKTMWEKL